jgi:hypothetical protein
MPDNGQSEKLTWASSSGELKKTQTKQEAQEPHCSPESYDISHTNIDLLSLIVLCTVDHGFNKLESALCQEAFM